MNENMNLSFHNIWTLLGLIGATAFSIYYRKEKVAYLAAPFFFVGGASLVIFVTAIHYYIREGETYLGYLISYLLLQEEPVKVSSRLFHAGYLPVWYAVCMLVLYPFNRKHFKSKE